MNNDGEDFLVNLSAYGRAVGARMVYLELGCGIGRIRRKQLEHVDDAAHGPSAHAIVLVLQ